MAEQVAHRRIRLFQIKGRLRRPGGACPRFAAGRAARWNYSAIEPSVGFQATEVLKNGPVIIRPRGVGFAPDTATELDDEFFNSDPAAYFGARLATLLTDAPPNGPGPESALATAVGGALEPGCLDQVLNADKRERELQIAIDAFALRHHVAESLVRLYHGLAVATGPCTWARISEGPYRTRTLVKECRTHLFSETGHAQFWMLILPVSVAAEPESERISVQLNVAADWLRYAMHVLVRDDINLGTAHNRMKHGFAVRANDDLLMTLTAQPPALDGSVPLSALTEPQGSDIVAGPSLHYLSRARVGKRDQGWEFNTVNLHPHLRLAEASMMITTLSAMFHLAAKRHFDGRATALPHYPNLPTGPTPSQLLAGTVIGLRQAITNPPDGEPTDRPTGLATHEAFQDLAIDFANATTGIVVDG